MLVRRYFLTLGLFVVPASSLAISLAIAIAVPSMAKAQIESTSENSVNPTSVLLLNRGQSSTIAIDTGRYTVRPKAEPRVTPVKKHSIKETPKEASKEMTKETSEETRDPVTVVVPNSQDSESSGAAIPAAQQIVVRCEEPSLPTATPSNPSASVAGETARRINVLDLSFAPGFLYNSSESSYAFRNYASSAPTLHVEANVWLSPTFSLHGAYTSTLSGHVNDSANGSRNVSATQEWFLAGIRTRKFFGSEKYTAALIFGVDYYDYQFRVPADAATRGGLHTSGVQLMLEAEIPANRTRSWIIGVTLAPKLKHTESATTVDFKSGGSVDANAVGLVIGSRIQLERNDSIFWRASHTVEKDLFSGAANVADPHTGTTPTGVAVLNSFTMLQIGYTWGN